jgi:Pilus formation protein N terminal region
MKTLLIAIGAAILVFGVIGLMAAAPAMAQPPIATETVHVTQGLVTYYRADSQSFATISVGDISIIDANPLTDRAVLIQAYKTGATNMIFFDRDKMPIKDVTVVVDAQGSGFVKIHNKAMLSSFTEYNCWQTGCQFRGETTVSEPAPLPRGYLNQTVNQSVTTQGNQPSIVVPRQ